MCRGWSPVGVYPLCCFRQGSGFLRPRHRALLRVCDDPGQLVAELAQQLEGSNWR